MTAPDGSGSDDGRGADGGSSGEREGLRTRLAKALFAFDPQELVRRVVAVEEAVAAMRRDLHTLASDLARTGQELHGALTALQGELEALRDGRVPAVETRLDAVENHLGRLQEELEALRDGRVPALESRADRTESAAAEVAATVEELRDRRLPAAVRRADLLIERLAQQIEEIASLAERVAAREPLPLPHPSADEERLAEALAEIQPRLLEALRGPEAEIAHRMETCLPLLEGHEPVLDLGCGRGELLGLLRERGVEATGIEGDPALARAARRRGLRVVEGDVFDVLLRLADGSAGAVTAIHIFEHLPVDRLLQVLGEVRRVLAPGGVLLAECPNPATLRVGADEFWNDPTHVRPLPARLLELLLAASGFVVEERRFLRPFPPGEALPAVEEADQAGSAGRLEELRDRLNELINGPRDYLLVARRSQS